MIVRRTAILGATTLAGREVAERLRDRGASVGDIITCEPDSDSNVLAAIGGDLVVSTPEVGEALDGADVAIVCAVLSAENERHVRAAGDEGVVVLDLTGLLEGKVVDPWGTATLTSLGGGVHSMPAASATLLATLVRAARAAGGRAPIIATCYEPASELGRPALDELYAQALAALKFSPLPTEELGRQWVHDVVTPGKDGAARELRLRREVAGLTGETGTSLLVLRPGLFHGVAVAARADVSAAAWEKALRTQQLVEVAEDDEASSPASAARTERAVVGRLTDDEAGGAWAFAAADSLAFGSVGGVVALLERSTRVSR